MASAGQRRAARSKRGLLELAGAIKCSTGRSALAYMMYGCYCGLGGQGWPRDRADWWVRHLLQDVPARSFCSQFLLVISSPSFLPQYPQFPFINTPQPLPGGKKFHPPILAAASCFSLLGHDPPRHLRRALTICSEGSPEPGPAPLSYKIAAVWFQPQGCNYPPTAVSSLH